MVEINFDYLKNSTYFKDQYEAANRLTKLYFIDDYRDVITNCRLFLETTVKKIFDIENLDKYYSIKAGEYRNLRNDTQYLRSHLDLPLSIYDLMDEVRRMGNDAVHDPHYHFTKNQAWRCLCDMNDILIFLINSYENQNLHYMRPDTAMDAVQNKNNRFRKRNKKMQTIKKETHNENAELAREVIKNKKKKGFKNRLKHFFKH